MLLANQGFWWGRWLRSISMILILGAFSFPVRVSASPENRGWILQHPKMSQPELIHAAFADDDAMARVIVHFRTPASVLAQPLLNTARQRKSRREEIRFLRDPMIAQIESDRVRLHRGFDYLPVLALAVSAEGLAELAQRDDILAIELDKVLEAHTAQAIAQIQALAVRNIYGGSGIAIAICDTGIDYAHPQLGNGGFPNDKVIGGYDFGSNDSDPMDTVGHGTSCAGIAAGDLPGGDDSADGDYIGGVAPHAKLYALKISPDSAGTAHESDMIASWEWCVTHKEYNPDHPILVISTSFGGGGYGGSCDDEILAMTQAAANAVNAGISIFASSGNDGYCGQIAWPACISHVISVGAVFDDDIGAGGFCVDGSSCASGKASYSACSTGYVAWFSSTAADQVAPYSNVSESLDLFAPAHMATTTVAGGGFVDDFGGTSAACPYAAGVAAIMQSAVKTAGNVFLAPADIRTRLQTYGEPIAYAVAGITKPRPDLSATDIDGDGMPAGWEIDYFSSIARNGIGDYDGDGLADLAEYEAGTQPDDGDTDDDGVSDGYEITACTDPLDSQSYPVSVPAASTATMVSIAILLFALGVLGQRAWRQPPF